MYHELFQKIHKTVRFGTPFASMFDQKNRSPDTITAVTGAATFGRRASPNCRGIPMIIPYESFSRYLSGTR